MIARPRLERRLDGALGRRLTCVVAGPGFGKTTLLTRWAAGTASAWHGLGPGDRTLGGLVRRVTDVLRARVPGLPPELLAAVRAARGPDTGTDEAGRAHAYAARICEALATAQPRDLVLVLDDLEAIDGATESVAFVAGLCRQAPATLHVVLASRSDPPFPLTRLRGQGQVLDMVAADLAFTAAETGEVVAATVGPSTGHGDDTGTDGELAAEVHRVTSGWPAAVRLTSEALAHEAPDGRLATLERLRRPGGTLYAYLADEVLATEAAEVRELLGRLAALDRFTPDLAAAVGPPGTVAALGGLVRRGLVVATPGAGQEWLTLNALIRGVLTGDGAGSGDGDIRSRAAHAAGTRADAARWFEQHGQPADALRCALIGDPVSAADAGELRRFVARWGPRLLSDGDADLVLAAVERIGPDDRTGAILRAEGEARQLVGDWDGALACFEEAAAGSDPLPAALAWRTGLIHHLRGDLDTALAIYRRGDLSDRTELVDAALLVAWNATAHWLRGEGDVCRSLAVDAMDRARRSGDDRALAAAHTALALVAALDGDRLANDSHYLRALDHAERAGDLLQIIRIRLNRGSRLNEEGLYDEAITELDLAIGLADLGGYAVFKAMALGNRGEARGHLGQLELAVDDLEGAKSIFQRLGSMMVSYPLGQLADVYRARGQVSLARMAWNEAADVARVSGDLQGLVPALAGLARLLAAEDPAAARSLADEAVEGGFGLGHVDALIARGWALAAGDEAARREAADVAAGALGLARDRRDRAGMAEAYELQAAVCATPDPAGEPGRARALLLEALALAEELRSPLQQGRVLLALARLGDPDAPAFARRAERLLRPLGARRLAEEAVRLSSAPRAAPAVAIQCLGGFVVLRNGTAVPLTEWKSRKARDLVKMLIARNGRPVHRGVLMDLLWPDEPPERTASRLSVTLSTARAVLDPTKAHPPGWFLAADNDTIGLAVDHVEVDVLRFLDLAGRALAHRKDGPSPAALDSLEEAEAAYVGDAFPEDPYEDWAVSLRERARAAYTAVARTLADDAAGGADTATAVRCYLRVLEHDAFDEGAHLGLVATQLAAGQQGAARRSYRAYCTRMDELAVEAAPFPP